MNSNDNQEKKTHAGQIKGYLQDWKQSGKTQLAFSKEKGINYYTFNKWVNDAKRKRIKPGESSKGFIPLTLSASQPFAEIKKDHTTIVFHHAVTADFLRSLLK